MSCIVGSCALQDNTYNRPGEVILLGFEEPTIGCWVLDGHSQIDSSSVRLRSTCTSVAYDHHFDSFVSSGYDGAVIFWNADSTTAMAKVDIGTSPINSTSINDKNSLLVCGSQDGYSEDRVWLTSLDSFI
jgi:WD40 repeat protein